MLKFDLDSVQGILEVVPSDPLDATDFAALTQAVDAYLTKHGKLHGLLLHAQRFPGWNSFAAFLSHVRFVHDHHRKIERVALVTDSEVLPVIATLAAHFVSAQVKHFGYAEMEQARAWLSEPMSM